MRELKFRAWDRLDKEFTHNIDCLLDMSVAERVFALDDEGGELIIEQCTGLKDKNGKDIYEGDIVQIDDHILGDFEVVWHNLGWKIKRSVGFETLSVHKSEDIVVIGNIHENPELLKKEK